MKAPRAPSERAPAPAKRAERVYGLAAAQAAFATRPDAVLSIAYAQPLRHTLADMLRSAARRRIAYREVAGEELSKLAQSVHHEGICLLVQARPEPSGPRFFQELAERSLVIALDGVQNPHNVGAILRSAAYFGVRALVYAGAGTAEDSAAPSLPAAARRVAEGGAEFVAIRCVPSLSAALSEAKRAGFIAIGSDAHAESSVDDFVWPTRALLVLGHEQRGLSRPARDACQSLLRIAGSDRVDSLNVSVAAGIFMSAYARNHGVTP